MTPNYTPTPTGFHGYQYMIYCWTLFSITTIFVCIRMYVQLSLQYRPWRELLVVGAWCGYVIVTVGEQLRVCFGYYHFVEMDYTNNPHAVLLLKVTFSCVLTFRPIVYLCKAALLCFYMDLTPRHLHPRIWWNIIGAWGFVVFGILSQVFFTLFTCRPLVWFWDPQHYMCYARYWSYPFGWVVFLFNDLQVYAIPFFILHSLQSLAPQHKRAAYWMFTAGFVNIASAGFMLAVYSIPGRSRLLGKETARNIQNGVIFMCPFQIATAIIIVCLPQARRLWLGLSEEEMRRTLEEQLREAKAITSDECNKASQATTLAVDSETSSQRSSTASNADLEAQF